jgi:shikimate kinase
VLFARSQSGTRPLAHDEAQFEALYVRRRSLYGEVATAVVRTAGRERLAWVVDRVIAAVAA